MINQNGDLVSVVPTAVLDVIADATAEDVNFPQPCFVLPAADGALVVKDYAGTTVSVPVKEGQFFPAMVMGVVAAGSDAISYSYWK